MPWKEESGGIKKQPIKYGKMLREISCFSSEESGPMTQAELLREKRQDILRIAAQYGASNVRVFGSVVRGDADEQSDIDLLVDLEPGRSLFDLGGLLMDVQDLLGYNVDVVTAKGLRERIREQVMNEAAAL